MLQIDTTPLKPSHFTLITKPTIEHKPLTLLPLPSPFRARAPTYRSHK